MQKTLLLNGRTPNCKLQLKLGGLSSKKALGSAATTIWGFCTNMIGKSSRYTRFCCEPFPLPRQLNIRECQIENERHFMEFLLRNDWIQRLLGIKMKESDGFFPDIFGEIYDDSNKKIDVELEYRAEHYAKHGHAFGGCHLILSFIKYPEVRFVKGVPVWSFYEGHRNDQYLDLCLFENINFDFSNYNPDEISSQY